MRHCDNLMTVVVLHSGAVCRLRQTISALVWHTRKPWELIVVSDRRDDISAGYLAGVRDSSAFRVVLLEYDEVLRWPSDSSEILRQARGRCVLFIKSGAITTEFWAEKMNLTLQAAPDIGLVGPMLNIGHPPQYIPDLAFAGPEDFFRFATMWCKGRRATWRRSPVISDECFLVNIATLNSMQSEGVDLEAACSSSATSGRFNALSNDTLFYSMPAFADYGEPLRDRPIRLSRGVVLPEFNDRGLLPPGDYPMTFSELQDSRLVVGRGDVSWCAKLVDNLKSLTGRLKKVGVKDLYIAGSFVEDCSRPSDIDGYFLCEEAAVVGGRLQRKLNPRFGPKVWDWDPSKRRPGPGSEGISKMLMWHRYRVELMPDFGQKLPEFRDRYGNELRYRDAFRLTKGDLHPKGVIKLLY